MKNIFTLLFIIIFNYKVNSLDLVPCINRNVNKSNVIDLCNKDGEEDFAFTGKKELYHKISKFKSNLIPVMLNSKWGVITRQRNTNLVHKCIGKCPQISQNNIYFLVIPFEYELINECSDKYCIAVKNSKWGIIDSYNKTIIDFKYEYLEFSDDLILAKKNKLYGFIDTNEKNMISFKYDFAKTFSNKLAPVYISKKCGYIDKDGKMVISPIYDECNSFSKEITSVKKNNLWGYIDKVGKTVIPFNFEAANPFYNGIASVKEKGKWYLINEKGDRIKMINCDDIYPFSEGGIARCKKDSKYGFINIEGKFIINPIYEEAKDFDFYLAEVKLNGKQIILDTFNRSLFKDFDKTYNFDHYIIVEKENKKGLIDKDLKDILPIKFDDIKIINDDLFFVKSENYWNIINKNNTIISPKYTQIEPETYSNPPKLFKICDEKGCGVFSISDKKEIINTYYNDIQIYESCIIVTKDKKSGIYDRQGNIMLPVEYDSSFEIVGNLVKFKKDNKYGLFSIKEKNIKIYPNYSEIYVLNDLIIEAQTKDNKKICFSTTTFKQTNCPF